MKINTMLSKAKQENEIGEGELKLITSTEDYEVLKSEEQELPIYVGKKNEKDKLTALLGDADVKLIQVSNGKPVLIVHSKHGTMHADFSTSASNAGKLLKTFELPIKTTSVKGDGGLILTIEKISSGVSAVDLVNEEAISTEALAFIWTAIDGKLKQCNVLVVGNGSDRMELVNALSVFIPPNQRVAVLGGALHSSHWNSIEMPFEQAVTSASEAKFNRIIGEMPQAKNGKTLHSLQGSLKGILSMPGNTCQEALNALREINGKAANALFDLAISVHSENGKMKLNEVSEVVNGRAMPLYALENGKLVQVKLESELVKQAVYRGVSQNAIENLLQQRTEEVKKWNENGVRSNSEIRMQIRKMQES